MVFAFSHRLDACTSLEAELWGLYHGLSLAWGKGYKKMIIETDSMEAIELFDKRGSCSHHLQHLLEGILEIGKGDIKVKLNKIVVISMQLLQISFGKVPDKGYDCNLRCCTGLFGPFIFCWHLWVYWSISELVCFSLGPSTFWSPKINKFPFMEGQRAGQRANLLYLFLEVTFFL